MGQGSPMAFQLDPLRPRVSWPPGPAASVPDPFVEFSLGLHFSRSGQVSIPLLMHCGSGPPVEGQSALLALCIYFLLASESSGIRAREIEGLQRKGAGISAYLGFQEFLSGCRVPRGKVFWEEPL